MTSVVNFNDGSSFIKALRNGDQFPEGTKVVVRAEKLILNLNHMSARLPSNLTVDGSLTIRGPITDSAGKEFYLPKILTVTAVLELKRLNVEGLPVITANELVMWMCPCVKELPPSSNVTKLQVTFGCSSFPDSSTVSEITLTALQKAEKQLEEDKKNGIAHPDAFVWRKNGKIQVMGRDIDNFVSRHNTSYSIWSYLELRAIEDLRGGFAPQR